jgi:hypothetical protein
MPLSQRDLVLARKFYESTEDREIEPNSPFYIPLYDHDKNLTHSDPIRAIARKIALSRTPGLALLSGHTGCGKSTELLRLRQELAAERTVAFIIDITEYLNIDMPVDLADFLAAIAGALSDRLSLKTCLGNDPARLPLSR